jgi:hypothetical protein
MRRIIEQRHAGGMTISDEEVALISPLAYAHVIQNGTYFFDRMLSLTLRGPLGGPESPFVQTFLSLRQSTGERMVFIRMVQCDPLVERKRTLPGRPQGTD